MSKSEIRNASDRSRPIDHQKAHESGDDGTNDLLVSDVPRTNEKQVWFLAEHAVDVPLVKAD